jgi:hypothetical protein
MNSADPVKPPQTRKPLLLRTDVCLVAFAVIVSGIFIFPSITTLFSYAVVAVSLSYTQDNIVATLEQIFPSVGVDLKKMILVRSMVAFALFYFGEYIVLIASLVFGFAAPLVASCEFFCFFVFLR